MTSGQRCQVVMTVCASWFYVTTYANVSICNSRPSKLAHANISISY